MDSFGGGDALGAAHGSIELDARNAMASLKNVQQGLRNLGNQQVGGGFAQSFTQQLRTMQQGVVTLGQNLRTFGTYLTAGITLPLVAVGKTIIGWAADLEESVNKVNVIFGDASQAVLDFSNNSAQALGFSKQQTLDFTSAFAGMLQPIASSKEELASMSTEMTQLTSDFASFHNLNPEEAFTVIQSAMAGETEAIRRYGVDVSAAAVETKALELGLAATTGELTEQDKALARYHLILEQTTEEQGDFARTSDSVSNKMKIQQARIQDLGTRFGKILLPAVSAVLDILSGLTDAIERLTPTQQRWVVGIAAAAAALGPLLIAIGAMLPALALLLSPIGLVVAGIAALAAGVVIAYRKFAPFRNAVDAVAKGIKLFVNVFRQANRATDPLSAALAALMAVFPGLQKVITPVLRTIERFKQAFRTFTDVFGQASKATDPLSAALSGLMAVFPGLQRFITPVLQVIENLKQKFDELTAVFEIFRSLGANPVVAAMRAVGITFPVLAGYIDGVLASWALWKDAIDSVVDALGSFLQGNWSEGFAQLGQAAQSAWDAILTGLRALGTLIVDVFQAIPWGAIGAGIAAGARAAWNGIVDAVSAIDWGAVGSALLSGAQTAIGFLADLAVDVWGWIQTAADAIPWSAIGAALLAGATEAVGFITDLAADVWGWIATKAGEIDWVGIGLGLGLGALTAIDALLNLSADIWGWIEEKAGEIPWDTIGSGLLTGVQTAADYLIGFAGDIWGWIQTTASSIPWAEIGNTILTGVTGAIDSAISTATGLGDAVLTWISDQIDAIDFTGVGLTLKSRFFTAMGLAFAIGEDIGSIIGGVISLATSILDWVTQQIEGVDWNSVGSTFAKLLVGAIKGAVVGTVAIVGLAGALLGGILNSLVEVDWGAVGTTFKDFLVGAIKAVTGFFVGFATTLYDEIAAELGNVDWAGLASVIEGAASGLWDGIVAGLAGIADEIQSTLYPVLNSIISSINDVIDAINKIAPGPDIPKIPLLLTDIEKNLKSATEAAIGLGASLLDLGTGRLALGGPSGGGRGVGPTGGGYRPGGGGSGDELLQSPRPESILPLDRIRQAVAAFNNLKVAAEGARSGIDASMVGIKDAVTLRLGEAITSTQAARISMAVAGTAIGTALGTSVSTGASGTASLVLGAALGLVGTARSTSGQGAQAGTTVGNAFGRSEGGGMSAMGGTVLNAALGRVNNARSTSGQASGAGTTVGRSFGSGESGGISALGGAVAGASAGLVRAAAGAGSGARSAGQGIGSALGNGVVAGIASAAAAAAAAAGNLVKRAIDAALAAGAISSPSRIMRMLVGRNLGLGVELGITDLVGRVAAAGASLVKAAIPVDQITHALQIVSRNLKAFGGDFTPKPIVDAALALDAMTKALGGTINRTMTIPGLNQARIPAYAYAGMGSSTTYGGNTYVDRHVEVNGVTINQQPGESSDALLDRLERRIWIRADQAEFDANGPVSS